MLSDSDSKPKHGRAVGLNNSIKLIRAGKAIKVWLASDADSMFVAKVANELSKRAGIELDRTKSSKELAEREKIEVNCAIVTEY